MPRMSYKREWVTANTGIIMVISSEAQQIFLKYSQNENHKTEAGGILIGRRKGAHFEIVAATEPTQHDIRTRTRFVRSEKIHSDIAKAAWVISRGQISYIGEWHTHPQTIPSPSSVDIEEWNKLSKECKSADGYSMIIVGINGLWCGIAKNTNQVISMIEAN